MVLIRGLGQALLSGPVAHQCKERFALNAPKMLPALNVLSWMRFLMGGPCSPPLLGW